MKQTSVLVGSMWMDPKAVDLGRTVTSLFLLYKHEHVSSATAVSLGGNVVAFTISTCQ